MKRALALSLTALLLAGCEVGPDYQKPTAPTSTHFKEADGWKPAEPQPVTDGAWWSLYGDPVLSGLEAQVAGANQTVAQAEATYRQAQAAVKGDQSGFFPTLGVTADATRSGTKGGSGGATTTGSSGGGGGRGTSYEVTGQASWVPDLWGRVRRTVENGQALAQASAFDLAAARLAAQTTLATDYFQMRAADQQKMLLDDVIAGYRQSLRITQNQYDAGTVAQSDVITAQTQLEGAQAQAVATGIQRAQFEHAIAVLVGKPPADLTIPPAKLQGPVPVAPPGLPSTLLERRPDIAAAERTMAAANAEIGVATSAYFPDLTLSASGSIAATTAKMLIDAPQTLWSIGADLAETIFDGGARAAAVEGAKAAYDAQVANYRQTVLTSFQQVEDALAQLRILEQESVVEDRAVAAAREAVRLQLNQYQAGTTAFTAVVTAQATLANDEQQALAILANRMTASVSLIQAIGGEWGPQGTR